MIKLIIFDLDGVLVEAKNIHYESLNLAISKYDEMCVIDWNDHLSKYDGLKTQQKLDMLTKEKGLPISFHKPIWDEKQKTTYFHIFQITDIKLLAEAIQLEKLF